MTGGGGLDMRRENFERGAHSVDWVPLGVDERDVHPRHFEMNPGCAARAEILYEQLKTRPSPWGKGLWKDVETEKIAERCAQIFVENFIRCPNERLIPQDSMEMVLALNDTGDLDDVEALQQIENEFACVIPQEFFTEGKTFADLIEIVKNGRNSGKSVELTITDIVIGVLGMFVMAGFVFVVPIWCAISVYFDISAGGTEGWTAKLVASTVGKLIGVGIGVIFLMQMFKKDKRITWKPSIKGSILFT